MEVSLDRLRRALRIFGDMLKDLDGGTGPIATAGVRIASLGSALTRFAEFCVPQSMATVFRRYALQLLYATALVLIVTGMVFYKPVETAGWIVIGVTAALTIASWMVEKWLFKQRTGRMIGAVLAAIAVLLLASLALLTRFECHLPDGPWKSLFHAAAHLLGGGCVSEP